MCCGIRYTVYIMWYIVWYSCILLTTPSTFVWYIIVWHMYCLSAQCTCPTVVWWWLSSLVMRSHRGSDPLTEYNIYEVHRTADNLKDVVVGTGP